MQQTRERFQQQLNYAQQQSEAQVNNLRQESQNIAFQAQDSDRLGLVNLGAGLVGSKALLSPAQIRASEKIRKFQNSDLRFSQYQMNSEAFEMLDKQLAKQVKEGRWSEIPAMVEALSYADVHGTKIEPKNLKNIVGSEGIIKVDSYLDEKKFKTEFKSENGQIVRRITNRYQAVWKDSESLKYLSSQERAQFFLGSLVLSLGDEAIATGDLLKGSGLLKMAQSIVDGLQGLSEGLSESLVDLIHAVPELAKLAGQGIVALANDPDGSWQTVVEFTSNLNEVKGAIINSLNQDYEKLKSGSAFEKGHVIGKYTIDIISLVAVCGSASAIKSVATAGQLTTAIQRVKYAERVSALLPEVVLSKVGGPIAQAAKTIQSMPAAMRSGIKYSAVRQPEVANAIAQAYEKALVSGDTLTATYLKRMAASKQSISGSVEVSNILKMHSSLSEKMKLVEKTTKEGLFSRAISRQYEDRVTRQIVKTKITEVFSKSPVQLINEHRFTIGGDLGHSGLYVSEGSLGATRDLLAKETGKKVSELWIAEQRMKLHNLLDLTDIKTLDTLGVTPKMLIDEGYNITHVIGDTAKNNGFQGIIFNSAKDPSKVNIVIFN
ncbi:MAG: RES family NAD+ phosphorylase [Bdellovibrionaceae bacterium]|nr:RES family NAD+ phosphorylase [Pseudobdellovibrionaceae bacterium]